MNLARVRRCTLPFPGPAQRTSSHREPLLTEPVQYSALGDDLLEEAVRFLPLAWQMESVGAFKAHLHQALPQSSRLTRVRMARFICRRFFPNGTLDRPFLAMLVACANPTDRRHLIGYRFLRSEALIGRFVSEMIYPRVTGANGEVTAEGIESFVAKCLKRVDPKSTSRLARALVRTGHLARLSGAAAYQVRPIQPSFSTLTYVFHCDFGVPAMYRLEDVADAPFRRLFLLSAAELQAFLRRAEDADLLQGVQAGGLEQVRTRLTLPEAVSRITGISPDALLQTT